MNWIDILNKAVIFIGVPTIIGFLVSVGKKLQTLDDVKQALNQKVLPDLKNVRERFSLIEGRVNTDIPESIRDVREHVRELDRRIDDTWKSKLAPAHSPRQLNERGQRIFEESGIQAIIDERQEALLAEVKTHNPTNPYDAEQLIEDAVKAIPDRFPETIDTLKTGAFQSGESIDAVLFVGSIYLRNRIFKDLGFKIDDLDRQSVAKEE